MNQDACLMDDAGVQSARDRYRRIRHHTDILCANLSPEDQCVQSMPDASPAKWHRAHTTWFFEQFILEPQFADYQPYDRTFKYLFNSYYEAVGERHPRPMRGLLTRPSAEEVGRYRAYVDRSVLDRLPSMPPSARALLELGLQHEQQHQELLLTDMLHAFSCSPLHPAVLPDWQEPDYSPGPTRFRSCSGGVVRIGYAGAGFGFDNESPAHHTLLADFAIADRLVRNGEWLAFMADGGYRTPTLWMSDGWTAAQANGWTAPLLWRENDGQWAQLTLAGLKPVDPEAPVRHLSWYEADAFARWSASRLPREAEWEAAAQRGVLLETTSHVWQWTVSAYAPYPGFQAAVGAVGEYNGKFMINQMVLRGGSLATPTGHARVTYRNFFHPDKRWQFTGLRLARDV